MDILKIKQALKAVLENGLPGTEAHYEMMPYQRISADEAKATLNPRLSAVLMLLFEEDGQLKTLFIHRAVYPGAHSGQIAFPGGKKEEEDITLADTALRETHEEIGILPIRVEILGTLTDVYIPPSNFIARPYVGWLDHKPEFIAQAREVQLVFSIGLDELFLPDNRTSRKIDLPVYNVTVDAPCFLANGHVIWGATALMLNEFRWIYNKIS
jgi:8-oxo-dGTP pyrophosphatase MutT (NUDIX family)